MGSGNPPPPPGGGGLITRVTKLPVKQPLTNTILCALNTMRGALVLGMVVSTMPFMHSSEAG